MRIFKIDSVLKPRNGTKRIVSGATEESIIIYNKP